MHDQTPEMERINAQMREIMRQWVQNPQNKELKERYTILQRQYQRLLLQQKQASPNGLA